MRLPMIVASAFVLSAMLVIACGESNDSTGGGGGEGETVASIARPEVPAEYAGKSNPLSGDEEAITKGRALFEATCASCHGDKGRGDGAMAPALTPTVSDFTAADFADVKSDYIFWRITEGSTMEPFRSQRSAMTPYGWMDEDDRWRLVAFIESLRDSNE